MHEIGPITTFQIVHLAYRLPKLNISSLEFEEERNKQPFRKSDYLRNNRSFSDYLRNFPIFQL